MQDQGFPAVPGDVRDLAEWVRQGGGGFVPAVRMRDLLKQALPAACGDDGLPDWAAFAQSWDDMPVDGYMGDGGSYRTRRHAVFAAAPGQGVVRLPHRPHYQSREYNALNGGIERWFAPIQDEIAAGPSMQAVLACGTAMAAALEPDAHWDIEAHQFRIAARAGVPGRPTPEGVHRDGVDYVLVLLVRRENIASGTTTLHDAQGALRGSFTLSEPCDAAVLDDRRCWHGVTPVAQVDPDRSAFRDVLVVTWRRSRQGLA